MENAQSQRNILESCLEVGQTASQGASKAELQKWEDAGIDPELLIFSGKIASDAGTVQTNNKKPS